MEKYFYVRIDKGKISVAGNLRARLGTKIAGEGIFAGWDWDGRTFTLKNDRYGFYPVYFALEKDRFAVSPSIAGLLELGFSRTLDLEALAVFLRFSSFVGDDTAFEAIRAVPPGAVLTWENGDLQIRSDGVPIRKQQKIERREAIVTYGELFQKTIDKTLRTEKKVAVPLSGGRDSRHIIFSLCRTGNLPDACLTAIHPPPRANEDAKIARLICEKLGIAHHTIEQNDSRILTE
jgi:asparagine synthase (glutamine-hydrolysing)